MSLRRSDYQTNQVFKWSKVVHSLNSLLWYAIWMRDIMSFPDIVGIWTANIRITDTFELRTYNSPMISVKILRGTTGLAFIYHLISAFCQDIFHILLRDSVLRKYVSSLFTLSHVDSTCVFVVRLSWGTFSAFLESRICNKKCPYLCL